MPKNLLWRLADLVILFRRSERLTVPRQLPVTLRLVILTGRGKEIDLYDSPSRSLYARRAGSWQENLLGWPSASCRDLA